MITDPSLGGACPSPGRRLNIGTRVSLRMRIPTQDHLIETPAVRWSNDEGAGVPFDGLRAGQVRSLTRFFETI